MHTLQTSLAPYDIEVVPVQMELIEPRSEDLRFIARHKITQAYERIQKPCIAQDAGFYIHPLKEFPRTFVKFALDTVSIEGILRLTEGKPYPCDFRNCLAYLDEHLQEPVYFESAAQDTVAASPRGEVPAHAWSVLWSIFLPDNEKKTLAEMTEEEFQAWRKTREPESFTTKFGKWLRSSRC